MCIEEYGKCLGYVYFIFLFMFFIVIFECKIGEDVKWVNLLLFDIGVEDFVMLFVCYVSEWIVFF